MNHCSELLVIPFLTLSSSCNYYLLMILKERIKVYDFVYYIYFNRLHNFNTSFH